MRGLIIAAVGAVTAAVAGGGVGVLIKAPEDVYGAPPSQDGQPLSPMTAQQAWQPTEGAPPPYWAGPETSPEPLEPLEIAEAPAPEPSPPVVVQPPPPEPPPAPHLPSASGDILGAVQDPAPPPLPPSAQENPAQPVDRAAAAP